MTTNGNDDTKIAQLTVDVIKKNGLDTADGIRDLAKRAREEGEAMAQFAEQVADSIISSSEQAANRIGGYIDRCAAARADVQKHKDTLADLPENRLMPDHGVQMPFYNTLPYPSGDAIAAVERAIGELANPGMQNKR